MAGASAFFKSLCVAFVLTSLEAESSTPGDTICTSSPPAQTPEDLAGQVIYCTGKQKKCLDRNKILLEDKCYTVGSPGPCRLNEILVIDKQVFMESKLVQGVCRPLLLCDRNQFQERMSHDQCCYETVHIMTQICSPERNLRLRKNVFGEGECALISNDSNTYTVPKDRLKDGFCYFPHVSVAYKYDLLSYEQRFQHLKVRHALTNITVTCSEQERACFESDQVLFRGDGACYPLLGRGPCPPGSWLVLDEGALEAERALTAVCRGPRCLPGRLFMAREQRCRSLEELQTELCAAEDLLLDVFGDAHCGRFTPQQHLLRMPRQLEGDTCALKEVSTGGGAVFGGGVPVLLPLCGPSDQNRCKVPVVHTPQRPRP